VAGRRLAGYVHGTSSGLCILDADAIVAYHCENGITLVTFKGVFACGASVLVVQSY
jgi:hypothetical protein